MIHIRFCNNGGEIDVRAASTPEEAAEQLRQMLADLPVLYPGDIITVFGEEE